MNSYKLKLLEGIAIVLTILLSHILLSVPSELATTTASATLLNIVFVTIITLIFFLIIYKLFSLFPGCNIIDISEFLGGKVFKFIYGVCYIAYILVLSSIMIRLFAEGLALISFSHIDIDFIMLLFVIAVGILNTFGLKAISRLNLIIIPLMVLSIVFIFFGSFGEYTFQRVFPLLGYGIKETFVDGISNIYSFSGLYVLFFIFPLLTKISEFKKVGITSILSYSFFLLLSVAALLFSIPQIANTTSPLSLYVLARQITLGDYIQSIDAIFLLIWIPFMLAYLSTNIHFALTTFKQLTNIKYISGVVYCFCAVIFVIALVVKNMPEINILSNVVYKYLSIGFVFVLSLVILVLACIKKLILKLLKKEATLNV